MNKDVSEEISEDVSKESKSQKLYREGKIELGQYSAMRLCELSGQKDYKGSHCFIECSKNIDFKLT